MSIQVVWLDHYALNTCKRACQITIIKPLSDGNMPPPTTATATMVSLFSTGEGGIYEKDLVGASGVAAVEQEWKEEEEPEHCNESDDVII